MELYLNSPAYFSRKFGVDDEIYKMCRKLSKYMKDKEYSEIVDTISIFPIVAPKEELEDGGWKEEKRYSLKCGLVTVWKQIDYDLYCQADMETRKMLIIQNILDSVKSIHKKAKFDYEKFEKDVNCFVESNV